MTNLCACMGAIKGDPYCPCEMKQRGLDVSHHKLSDQEMKEFNEALQKICNSNKENDNGM